MKRSEKEHIVADVSEIVGRAHGMFFTDFTGLTVEQATELRREFRKSGIDYQVVKNTLIRKALESVSGYDRIHDKLVGPTGVAFAYEDPVAPARIIQKFNEKHQKLSLKVCVVENEVFDGSRLDELAKLPSKHDLLSGIVGTIEASLAGVPTIINAVFRDLASVVGEIEKKKAE